jgi:hypothetical protein
MEAVMTLAAMGQALDLGACDVLDDPDDDHYFSTATTVKSEKLAELIEADPEAVECCECAHDDRAGIAVACATSDCTDAGATSTDGEVEVLVDMVGEVYEDARAAGAFGLTTAGDALRAAAADPSREALREPTWDWCGEADSRHVASLLAHVPGDPDVLGPGDAPGDVVVSADVSAAPGATVTLTGPIAALRCDDGEPEQDEIVVKVVGDVTAEVERRPTDAAGLLLDGDGVAYDLDALAASAGLDPATESELTIEVWRETPGCAGLYGDALSEKLFDGATVDVPWSAVVDSTLSYITHSGYSSGNIPTDTPPPVHFGVDGVSWDVAFAAADEIVAV